MRLRSFQSRDRGTRRSITVGGEPWTVSERDAPDIPGARTPMCLVFESQAAVRRSWTFPPNWRDMQDGALWRLSELTASRSSLLDKLQTVFISSIVAQETASTLIAAARGVFEENRDERDQLKATILQCRATRREIHDIVASYAREERAAGKSAIDVLSSLEAPLQHTAFVVSDPPRTERLESDIARWCDEGFRAA